MSSKNDRFGLMSFQLAVSGISIHEIDYNKLIDADKKLNFYKPLGENKFEELKESIKEHGILHPLLVWETDDPEKYIILSGHNRKRACECLYNETLDEKYKNISCRIYKKDEITETNAEEIIIDTNWVQRELSLLERVTSIAKKYEFEKAKPGFSYKRSVNSICNQYELKERQLMYYKKINNLKEEFLNMIEKKKISIKAGAKIADFSIETQNWIFEFFKNNLKNVDILKLEKNMDEEAIRQVLLGISNHDEEVKLFVNIPKKLVNEFEILWQEFKTKHTLNN